MPRVVGTLGVRCSWSCTVLPMTTPKPRIGSRSKPMNARVVMEADWDPITNQLTMQVVQILAGRKARTLMTWVGSPPLMSHEVERITFFSSELFGQWAKRMVDFQPSLW